MLLENNLLIHTDKAVSCLHYS